MESRRARQRLEGFRGALRQHRAHSQDGGGNLSFEGTTQRPRRPGLLATIQSGFDALDVVLVWLSAFATIGAGLVLTYSVAVRYFVHASTDWQGEMAVFLLVGATFLSRPRC